MFASTIADLDSSLESLNGNDSIKNLILFFYYLTSSSVTAYHYFTLRIRD